MVGGRVVCAGHSTEPWVNLQSCVSGDPMTFLCPIAANENLEEVQQR